MKTKWITGSKATLRIDGKEIPVAEGISFSIEPSVIRGPEEPDDELRVRLRASGRVQGRPQREDRTIRGGIGMARDRSAKEYDTLRHLLLTLKAYQRKQEGDPREFMKALRDV